jgi:hypothetical protein
MERAKLSGDLLVSKLPPHAGRSVQYLRSVPDDADAEAFAAAAAPRGSAARRGGRKMALRVAAIGAALIAVASVAGLVVVRPVGRFDAAKPTLSVATPMAAAKLAKAAIEAALQPPALHPAAIVLPRRESKPAAPPSKVAAPAEPMTTMPKVAARAEPTATIPKVAAPAEPAPTTPKVAARAELTTTPKVAAPASPAPAAASALPRPAAAPAPVESPLRTQGNTLFAAGHLAEARIFYERAAQAGDGRAALQLGETYDPAFLAQAGLVGERGNAAAAAYWYRQAEKLGAADAAVLLKAVMAEPAGPAPR